MKRLKAFFYIINKSISDPMWYKDMLNTTMSFSMKYLFSLAFLLSILVTGNLYFTLVPEVNKGLSTLIKEAKLAYPQDLVIEIKDGQWFINRPEPFVVPLPKTFESTESNLQKTPKNFIVMYKAGTLDDLERFDTFILVNNVNVIVRNNNKIEAYPIKDAQDGKLDYTTYISAIDQLSSYTVYVAPVMLSLIFVVVFLANSLFRLIPIFISTIFVWIIAKALANQTKTGYITDFNKIYRVVLHTSTLPILLSVVMPLLPQQITTTQSFVTLMAYLPTAYIIGFSVYVLSKLSNQKA